MTIFSQLRILVDDFAASYEFYHGVLGLKPQSEAQAAGPYACFKSPDGADIAIFQRAAMGAGLGVELAERGAGEQTVIVFRMPDVDAEYAQAVAKGAVSVREPHEQPAWRMRVAYLRAPEGTLIEFCAWSD